MDHLKDLLAGAIQLAIVAALGLIFVLWLWLRAALLPKQPPARPPKPPEDDG